MTRVKQNPLSPEFLCIRSPASRGPAGSRAKIVKEVTIRFRINMKEVEAADCIILHLTLCSAFVQFYLETT